ncbi:MAG: DUF4097 family beta strand repeat-containing protein [Bacteroidota bacterium]
MKNIRLLSLITVLILCVTFGINAQTKIDESFTGITKIDMTTASGNCIVKKASGSKVDVSLEHTFGDDYNPVIEKNGNKLVIKEERKRRSWNGKATWVITIPDGIDMKYNTGSGNFEASDLDLELSINTGSGNLDLVNMNGDISANSGSGNMDLNEFSGDVHVNIGSGNLDLSEVSGSVTLNCGSGNIKLDDVKADIGAHVGSGNIRGYKVVLTGTSDFNSGSGNVRVTLTESPKHNISLNSGSGGAKLDLGGNDFNGTVIMTANKKNGSISAPFKFDNVEEIKKDGNNVQIKKTAKLGSSDVEIKIGTGSGSAEISK